MFQCSSCLPMKWTVIQKLAYVSRTVLAYRLQFKFHVDEDWKYDPTIAFEVSGATGGTAPCQLCIASVLRD